MKQQSQEIAIVPIIAQPYLVVLFKKTNSVSSFICKHGSCLTSIHHTIQCAVQINALPDIMSPLL